MFSLEVSGLRNDRILAIALELSELNVILVHLDLIVGNKRPGLCEIRNRMVFIGGSSISFKSLFAAEMFKSSAASIIATL